MTINRKFVVNNFLLSLLNLVLILADSVPFLYLYFAGAGIRSKNDLFLIFGMFSQVLYQTTWYFFVVTLPIGKKKKTDYNFVTRGKTQ